MLEISLMDVQQHVFWTVHFIHTVHNSYLHVYKFCFVVSDHTTNKVYVGNLCKYFSVYFLRGNGTPPLFDIFTFEIHVN